jgi:hypothetical protein
MDLELSSLSTADYSFYNDPPDNNEYYFDYNSPNFIVDYSYHYPSTVDFTDKDFYDELSLFTYYKDRAGGAYFPLELRDLLWTNSTSTEIEFDKGVSPPCEDLPTEFICGRSYNSLSTIGSFNLRDTVLYPIPVNDKLRVYTKQLQEEDIEELRYLYKLCLYKGFHYQSQKFCHPYKLYGFWNTDTGEEYKAAGGLQLLLDVQKDITGKVS